MKKLHGIVFLVAIILVSCGKGTGRTLTSATGSIYECLVVMNDEALTQEQVNEVAKLSLVNEASGYTKPIASLYDLVEAIMGRHAMYATSRALFSTDTSEDSIV